MPQELLFGEQGEVAVKGGGGQHRGGEALHCGQNLVVILRLLPHVGFYINVTPDMWASR